MPALDRWRRTTAALLATLALVEICWELWLAPLKPGGSWLALKALPLVALWPGVVRSRTRALQWALLLCRGISRKVSCAASAKAAATRCVP
jgi:Predicted membrane protein (DUF2069).